MRLIIDPVPPQPPVQVEAGVQCPLKWPATPSCTVGLWWVGINFQPRVNNGSACDMYPLPRARSLEELTGFSFSLTSMFYSFVSMHLSLIFNAFIAYKLRYQARSPTAQTQMGHKWHLCPLQLSPNSDHRPRGPGINCLGSKCQKKKFAHSKRISIPTLTRSVMYSMNSLGQHRCLTYSSESLDAGLVRQEF